MTKVGPIFNQNNFKNFTIPKFTYICDDKKKKSLYTCKEYKNIANL